LVTRSNYAHAVADLDVKEQYNVVLCDCSDWLSCLYIPTWQVVFLDETVIVTDVVRITRGHLLEKWKTT
jgi:hypothetical protein